MKSHKESGKASIYLAREKYNKAKLQMDQAQQNIDKMQVTSPMDGLVSIQKNQTGDFFFTGMSVPDFHTGDQAHPGSAIAQIVDPSGLELSAKLPEQDSTAIKAGQPVDVVFDAMPGHKFRGTVKTIGGVSSANIFEGESGGNFEVTLQLATLDPRLHPGFTAQMVFVGDHKSNALYIPKQAVFLKDGKRVVYIKRGGAYDPQVVKIVAETESRAVIDSLSPGTQVALIDPTAPRKPSNMSPASTGTP
jgi:HlyD family secretion protein